MCLQHKAEAKFLCDLSRPKRLALIWIPSSYAMRPALCAPCPLQVTPRALLSALCALRYAQCPMLPAPYSLRYAPYTMKIDLNKYQAIVFDFDGVIADSVEVKTEAFAKLFEAFEPTIRGMVVNHHMKNGGMPREEKIKHFYHHFIGKTIDRRKLKNLCEKFSALVVDKIVAAPEIPGAEAFIKSASLKTLCFIDSATPDHEIIEIVKRRSLTQYFKEILGSGQKKSCKLKIHS